MNVPDQFSGALVTICIQKAMNVPDQFSGALVTICIQKAWAITHACRPSFVAHEKVLTDHS